MIPTPAVYENFPDILALNAESVHFLSPLSGRQLEHLHAQAAYHKVVVDGQRVAGGSKLVSMQSARVRALQTP